MEKTLPTVTNIREDAESGWFIGTVYGKPYKIKSGADDPISMALDKAIADGAMVESKDQKEMARKELVELDEIMPRHLEELIDVLPVESKNLYLATKTSIKDATKGDVKARKELLRGQLQ